MPRDISGSYSHVEHIHRSRRHFSNASSPESAYWDDRSRSSAHYDSRERAHRRDARNASSCSSSPPKKTPRDNEDPRERAQRRRRQDGPSTKGASVFRGFVSAIPYTLPGHYRYFAIEPRPVEEDRTFEDEVARDYLSLRLIQDDTETNPWDTLEQPSMAFAFGPDAGTVSLNHWVGLCGNPVHEVDVETILRPRPVELIDIVNRLGELAHGIEDDDQNELYDTLYGKFLYDPQAGMEPHVEIHQQVVDLLIVLGHPEWIDFSQLENQVVTKYVFNNTESTYRTFLLQLVLSAELLLRIRSPQLEPVALFGRDALKGDRFQSLSHRLLTRFPPKITWTLGLADRWLSNISIDERHETVKEGEVVFDFRSKFQQADMLYAVAWKLKWPNLEELLQVLSEVDPFAVPLEKQSAESMAFFTGLALPGISASFTLMKTLVQCDQATKKRLQGLDPRHPNTGFQYGSSTYWSWKCVVGKVLGAAGGVNQVAGWIGPCHSSPDLDSIEAIRVHQQDSIDELSPAVVRDMDVRSNTIASMEPGSGPDRYEVLEPNSKAKSSAIRMERLSFARDCTSSPTTTLAADADAPADDEPALYNAAVVFAFEKLSWPIRLRYDVEFVAAVPCHAGPHPLHTNYLFHPIHVEDIIDLEGWPRPHSNRSPTYFSDPQHNDDWKSTEETASQIEHKPSDKVLVISALGTWDNDVFARAWCSHWGSSAVVANIRYTCMACGIREAHAAGLNVMILNSKKEHEAKEKDILEKSP